MKGRPRRPERRARDRGAAMLESIIVTPTFVALLAGVMLLGRLDSRRLEVAREARAAAFVQTSGNCGRPGETSRAAPPAFQPNTNVTVRSQQPPDPSENLEFPPAPEGVDPSSLFDAAADAYEAFGEVGNVNRRGFAWSAQGTTSQIDLASSTWSATVETRSQLTMLCNEPPYDGRTQAIARRLIDVARRGR